MNTLIEFYNFTDEMLKENSRTYKLSVLTKYKDNETIKYYLNYIYDPYKITGISDKKFNKVMQFTTEANQSECHVMTLLNYVLKHNTGTDELLKFIAWNIAGLSEELRNLFAKIITKNLILGVDSKTINKAIPNLIPVFNVQLANKYFENPKYVEGKEFALTTKIDGGRIIAIKENNEVSFFTRQGQKYTGLVDLEAEMAAYMPNNICLDGELTLLHPDGLASGDQYKATMKISRKDGEKHGVKMLVFDCMSAEEFKNQSCATPYYKRRRNLDIIFKDNLTYFNLVPVLYSGTDVAKITEWLNHNVTHGEEGIMINILGAPYHFTRSNDLLKCKLMQDLDLEVIGFEEGDNKYTGKLGALLVDYNGNTVKVGSGFTDELRQEIWQHQDEWLGRTVVIQYFEETYNADGGKSLRFPVYLDYRTDK